MDGVASDFSIWRSAIATALHASGQTEIHFLPFVRSHPAESESVPVNACFTDVTRWIRLLGHFLHPTESRGPFPWDPSTIQVVNILSESKEAVVYHIRCGAKECVAKVTKLFPPFRMGEALQIRSEWGSAAGRARSKVDVCGAWVEQLGYAKAYPRHFYGNINFYDGSASSWKSAFFMPLYEGTLDGMIQEHLVLTPSCTLSSPSVFFDYLAQILLHTIPKAKRSRIVSHNDLKADNLVWRTTTKQFVYVKITFPLPRPPLFLSIPTHGKMFYVIDFAWSTLLCPDAHTHTLISSTSPPRRLKNPMDMLNYYTDFAQLAYSILDLGTTGAVSLNPEATYDTAGPSWSDTLDVLFAVAATDDNRIIQMSDDTWDELFYSAVSHACTSGASLGSLLEFWKLKYDHPPVPLHAGRVALEYSASLLGVQF